MKINWAALTTPFETESKVMGQGITVEVGVMVKVQVFPGKLQGVGVGAQTYPASTPLTEPVLE